MFLSRIKQHNLFEFYNFPNLPRDKPRKPCLVGRDSRTALGFFLGTAAGTVMVHFRAQRPPSRSHVVANPLTLVEYLPLRVTLSR